MITKSWATKFNQKLPLNLKIFALIAMTSLVGCSYYPSKDGEVHAQPLGDVVKCSDSKNHHLPSCFCHKVALKENPDRMEMCSKTINSWLKQNLEGPEQRTLGWLKEMRKVTADLESYKKDKFELWEDNTLSYLDGQQIIDDCDAVDSLLDIIFAMGGFRLDELAKVLVDSNPYDYYDADHYVAAVWVNNRWMAIDYYFYEPQPLLHLELGGIMARDGYLTKETKVVSYRRLDQANWHQGKPPHMESLRRSL